MKDGRGRVPEEPWASQRRAPRLRHLRQALYRTRSARGEGHLSTLSQVGAFLRCDDLPEVGESVWVLSESPLPAVLVQGCVRSVYGEEPERGFGFEIESASRSYVLMLEGLFEKLSRS